MDCSPVQVSATTPAQVSATTPAQVPVPSPSPVAIPIDENENIIDCPDEWVDIQPTVHVSSINEIGEDISTETLLHDLRTIVINEIGDKFSQELVSSFSGKTFTEADVSSVFQKILDEGSDMVNIDTIAEPITVDLPSTEEPKVSKTDVPEKAPEEKKALEKQGPEKQTPEKQGLEKQGQEKQTPEKKVKEKKVKEKKAPSDKPKRKNKIAAYNVFKKDKDMKKKIDEIYIPRKEQDKSLKFGTVAAEVWKTIDKTPFEKIANDLNEKNAASTITSHTDANSTATSPPTQLQKDA